MSTAEFLRWLYPEDGWGLSDAPGWIEVRALPAAGRCRVSSTSRSWRV